MKEKTFYFKYEPLGLDVTATATPMVPMVEGVYIEITSVQREGVEILNVVDDHIMYDIEDTGEW